MGVPNTLIQEVELDQENITIQLYSGYCAFDKSDVTINISDELISRSSNEQETVLFKCAGEELQKETSEYIDKHKHLHYKLPFYTHAGDLRMSNVIHCTLSQNKRTISEKQIEETFIECLSIADEELEASSVSFPMIYLRNYSVKRISRLMVCSVKNYIKNHTHNRSSHLQLIKIISADPKLHLAYMNSVQHVFKSFVKTFCEPTDTPQQEEDKPFSSIGNLESYMPSYQSLDFERYTLTDTSVISIYKNN